MVATAPHAAASIEAEEEAGVRGDVYPTALGSYRYRKKRRNGPALTFDVDVFALAVTQELGNWKESHQRERRWFSLADAADAVEEPELADLIRNFTPADGDDLDIAGPGRASGRWRLGAAFAWFRRLLP